MLNIYMDTEFTGLTQDTTLISIGLVSEVGHEFYATLKAYDESRVDPWIQENVIQHLIQEPYKVHRQDILKGLYIQGDEVVGYDENGAEIHTASHYNLSDNQCRQYVETWLKTQVEESEYDKCKIWCDCYAFDWVLFTQIWGGALKTPKFIHYIPRDLSTYLEVCGLDADVNRMRFANMEGGDQHNALWDAKVIRACVQKLEKSYHILERLLPWDK